MWSRAVPGESAVSTIHTVLAGTLHGCRVSPSFWNAGSLLGFGDARLLVSSARHTRRRPWSAPWLVVARRSCAQSVVIMFQCAAAVKATTSPRERL